MMEVMEEVRRGARAETRESRAEDVQQCTVALEKLNGRDRTMTSFHSGDIVIVIGGGDGDYIAYVETPRTILNVVNGAADEDDTIDVTVGGQACEFPASYVTEFAQVVAVLQEQLFGMEDEDVEYEVVVK
ncbi:hypothetical protein [Clavibacter sp. CT19]|uniref:hypothetical protein n=1 Tax=unclassified Clavibacter TaxID=2626594 RepID=UPI0022EB76CD|nr:hypothetical protein [Clavibacter sp. CT19]MDA3804458.1 hypothetical protein [Clavibacter sp. CT19]